MSKNSLRNNAYDPAIEQKKLIDKREREEIILIKFYRQWLQPL